MAAKFHVLFGGRGITKHAVRALAALGLVLAGAACGGGGSSGPGATGGQLGYAGSTTWTIVGPQGGPFLNSSRVFTLLNNSSDQLSWSATTIPSFVTLDQQSGVIAANSQIDVHADLNNGLASSLPPGMTEETLTFHNGSAPQADIVIDCLLSVGSGGSSTELLPTSDYSASGPAGGPFQPASMTYNLFNMGSSTLNWTTTAADAWLSVLPASGQLAAGGSVSLLVSIRNNATGSLAVGQYPSSWDVVDASSNSTIYTRDVTLDITPGSGQGGWTNFTPSNDTRTVYVSSSSGNDSNNGLSENTPKRTVAAGKALLRNTFPDWLLLKCGDTWDESLGEWENISGRSMTERMLISSYGTGERPLLRTGTNNGARLLDHGNPSSFIAFVGLHFWANGYNGGNAAPDGIVWYGHSEGLLIEDCMIQAYFVGICLQANASRHTNPMVRRNVIVDSYSTTGAFAQGMYTENCDGLLLEENVFDRNGWNDAIPGSIPVWFLHNVYIHNNNGPAVFRGNIVAGTDGVQIRPGGTVEDNVFLRTAIALEFGLGTYPNANGVSGNVRNNVMLDGGDIGTNGPSQGPRGWGLLIGNVTSATVEDNIICNNVNGHGPRVISVDHANGYGGNTRGVENTTFQNNIVYNWGGSVSLYGSSAQIINVQFLNNAVQNFVTPEPLVMHDDPTNTAGVTSANNQFYDGLLQQNSWMQVGGSSMSLANWMPLVQDTTSTGQQVSYPDPGRTIATYHSSIGGGASFDAFMAQARLQSKANWRVQYTAAAVRDYIRAGFGL